MFAATISSSGKEVVVKFSRRYGIEAHRFLASKEQAPKVLHFEPLPGNWCVVVMEKVDGKPLQCPIDEAVESKVKAALDNLHSEDFVHGDLRAQNILLLNDNSIRVADFDWAGKSGKVKYPENLSMSVDWHPDVFAGATILKEHNTYQFHQLT